MKRLFAVLMIILLSGCAGFGDPLPPTQFKGPDGGRAFVIGCSMLSECYKEAGTLCPGKYSLINTTYAGQSFPRGQGVMKVQYHYMALECSKN